MLPRCLNVSVWWSKPCWHWPSPIEAHSNTDSELPTLQVVFLGTGAAIPAKYRNVTGIYVHLFARGGLMLDCGAFGMVALIMCCRTVEYEMHQCGLSPSWETPFVVPHCCPSAKRSR